jgi:hypothetical protein
MMDNILQCTVRSSYSQSSVFDKPEYCRPGRGLLRGSHLGKLPAGGSKRVPALATREESSVRNGPIEFPVPRIRVIYEYILLIQRG